MSEQSRMRNSNSLNANLVALILILSAVLIGGVIAANVRLNPSPADGGNRVEVALVEATATPLPTGTPLPPTLTPTPLPTQTVAPTQAPPMTIADAGQAGANNAAASYDPALVSQGQTLFALCAACHGADARGLPNLGKDLVASEFVHSLSDEELLTFVKTGRPIWDPLNTTGIDMPPKGGNPAMTDEDILAIIAYLRSLAPSTAGTTTEATAEPPAVADAGQSSAGNAVANYDPALVSQGQALYMVCSACHGPDGRGLPNLGKDLVASEFVHSLSDEELLTFVKTGRPMWDPLNTTGIDMPPKGGNPAFTDDDILAIIAYLRSLSAASG